MINQGYVILFSNQLIKTSIRSISFFLNFNKFLYLSSESETQHDKKLPSSKSKTRHDD